jgi:hypothetical protein
MPPNMGPVPGVVDNEKAKMSWGDFAIFLRPRLYGGAVSEAD